MYTLLRPSFWASIISWGFLDVFHCTASTSWRSGISTSLDNWGLRFNGLTDGEDVGNGGVCWENYMFWMCPSVGFFSAQVSISSWNCCRESWNPTGLFMFQTLNGCDNFRQSASLRGNPSCRNSEGNEMCSVYICVLNENWKFPQAKRWNKRWTVTVIAVIFFGVYRRDTSEYPWSSHQFSVRCRMLLGPWRLEVALNESTGRRFFFVVSWAVFKTAILRLNIWYALWGWKEWIQHANGDATVRICKIVSVFPTDLGERRWKQKEWSNQNSKLYHFILNCTNSPCDTRDPVWWYQWYLWNDGMPLSRPSLAILQTLETWQEQHVGSDSCLKLASRISRHHQEFLFSEYCCVYCGRISKYDP